MLSYDSCHERLPLMPEFATLDGEPLFHPTLAQAIDTCNNYKLVHNEHNKLMAAAEVVPTLVSIGLLDALLEVEKVLAFNQAEKHPGAKWKLKSVNWHDSKSVSHLAWAQHVGGPDEETGRSHRAHAACRMLMSLARELQK